MFLQELLAINGGIDDYLYTIDYSGLTDAIIGQIAGQIVDQVPCPEPGTTYRSQKE